MSIAMVKLNKKWITSSNCKFKWEI